MDRRGSHRGRRLLPLAAGLLAAGCTTLPQAPGLLRPPGLVAPHRIGFEVSTTETHGSHQGWAVPPGIQVGLRHRLGDHLGGGVTLFLAGAAAIDLKAAVHLGPRVVVSVDPRLLAAQALWVLPAQGCRAGGGATSGGCGQGPPPMLGADLPLAVGVRIGPDQLVVGAEVSRWWALGLGAPPPGTYGAAALGLDVPVARLFLLPEIQLVCGSHPLGRYVAGGGCYEALTLSLHD